VSVHQSGADGEVEISFKLIDYIDYDSKTINVVRTYDYIPGKGVYLDTPKNNSSCRIIKISDSLLDFLDEYREWQEEQKAKCQDQWKNEDERVLTSEEGTPLHPDALTRWFRTFADENRFPDIHFHSLRHTYATFMIGDGVPLVRCLKTLGTRSGEYHVEYLRPLYCGCRRKGG